MLDTFEDATCEDCGATVSHSSGTLFTVDILFECGTIVKLDICKGGHWQGIKNQSRECKRRASLRVEQGSEVRE